MTVEPVGYAAAPGTDALALAAELPLTEDEAAYVEAARAPNTLRGYRSDWTEFTTWCTRLHRDPLPAAADTISANLTEPARAGAKVGTMSRRLSSIKFAHQLRNLPDPTTGARVVAVWEGIRRTHGAPPDQAAPLMPPQLFDVLDACPTTRTFKTRPTEPHLAGLRDRVLLLVGFFAALRRSELAALTVAQISTHDRGLVTPGRDGEIPVPYPSPTDKRPLPRVAGSPTGHLPATPRRPPFGRGHLSAHPETTSAGSGVSCLLPTRP